MRSYSLESDTRDVHQCGANFVPCNMDILKSLNSATVTSSVVTTVTTTTTSNPGNAVPSVFQNVDFPPYQTTEPNQMDSSFPSTAEQTYFEYYVGDQTPKRERGHGDGNLSPPVHTLSPFIFQQERKPIATRRYGSPLSPIDTSMSSLTMTYSGINTHEIHEVSRNTPITPLSPWSRHDFAYSPTESPSTVIYPVSESRERTPTHHLFGGILCS